MIFVLIIFGIVFNAPASSQLVNPHCNFTWDGHIYQCMLTIINRNGSDNFTRIDGDHILGGQDANVFQVTLSGDSVTTNIPSIICDTFYNIQMFTSSIINGNGIEEIGRNSFRNCSDIREIYLENNRISRIAENAFIGNTELRTLNLQVNLISELPNNIFRPLSRLQIIALFGNNLEVVHGNWFGVHPAVSLVGFAQNKIYAVDERLLEALPSLQQFIMIGNDCADGVISRPFDEMRNCFDNYERLMAQTTTQSINTTVTYAPPIEPTTPGQCIINDIYSEVCYIKAEMWEMERRIENLERIIAESDEKIRKLKEEMKRLILKNSEKLKSVSKK